MYSPILPFSEKQSTLNYLDRYTYILHINVSTNTNICVCTCTNTYIYKYVYLAWTYLAGTLGTVQQGHLSIVFNSLIRQMVRRNMPTLLGLCDQAYHTTKAIRDADKSRFTYTCVRRQTAPDQNGTKGKGAECLSANSHVC